MLWTEELAAELAAREAEFAARGGRGVEEAEEIDELHAQRSLAPYSARELAALVSAAAQLWHVLEGEELANVVLSEAEVEALDQAQQAWEADHAGCAACTPEDSRTS
jgi:hypothetical protein